LGQFVASYRPHEIEELEAIIQSGRSRYSELLNVRSIRGLLRILEEGKVLWFGPDQDMGTKGSVFAPFFGQQASTVTTPSWLAKRSNCAVFFLEMSRDSSGYQARFKPMPWGYPFEDEVRNATILNQMIEHSLNEHPTQYMWMHQRFKTQPDLPRYSLYK
jgi:KDO2-lipid IV(A) lauroyltransferase